MLQFAMRYRLPALIVVFALLFAKYWRVDIPDGISNPASTRLLFMLLQLHGDVGVVVGWLGLSEPVFTRASTSMAHALLAPFHTSLTNHSDVSIEGIRVRVHQAAGGTDGRPRRAVIYFHGGGFVVHGIETHTGVTDRLAHHLNAMVFSVEYRLAPEHTFPAGFDDCVLVTKYILQHGDLYGVDATRVAVMGDSAGGNLAAAVSIKLRDDKHEPMPKLQVLVYPVLQLLSADTPSYQYNQDTAALSRTRLIDHKAMYLLGSLHDVDMLSENDFAQAIDLHLFQMYFSLNYLPNDSIKAAYIASTKPYNNTFWDSYEQLVLNPYASPLLASNLNSLPSAYISSCQFDPLRDDAYYFEQRLRRANVAVHHQTLSRCLHAWMSFTAVSSTFNEHFADLLRWIDQSL